MVTLTAEDMQKKKNDVKARTTLLLSLLDEHQLRFSKYKTARELWAAILKTFGGNEATKKTKKNLLKQQYGNFKAEGSKTLEHTFNRLQVIIAKHNSGNKDGNTACVPTASTNVPTASASDINQIDEDNIEDMDIKWNMALLSMRADKFWKKTGKKISIQGSDDRGRRDNYRQGSKAKEQALKALMAIDGMGWDWSYMANDEEDHALVADEVAPTKFALMANTIAESKKLKTLKEEKEGVNGKLAGLLKALRDLDNLIESQRHSPTVESTSGDDQNRNPSVSETVASPITPKPFIQFVKPKDSQFKSKTGKTESPKKPPVKYAEQYRKSNKKPNVRGNQRNWNNLKTHQLGPDFVMKKKSCFNYGDFNHLAYDCRKRPFHRTSAVRSPHRAPWVLTVNMNFLPVNRKFSPGSRNFPTANRKFPTASRKFPTGSIKCSTANMGMKGKVVKPSACWTWKPSHNLSNKGNISYLFDFEPFDGGYVSFGQGGCKITRKGTIKTGKLEFENVYFVKDLKRLGHLNFKTMNKLVRHNLVRGLPTKCFENDHTCTACLKGKQHKASLTDDFSRFTWTFFLKSKDETSGILKKFITEIENLKVKIIRDEGYFIGYSMSSKAFRVFNKRTRRVEENLHVEFLENKAIEKGSGPNWLSDIDSLTKSMNYVPVDAGTISTNLSGTKDAYAVGNKMHKAFPLPVIKFPLAEEVPTASVKGCHCQKKCEATARKITLLC
nr:ribonuclease H-like domain-containing protein [Tanacetum cinerariifolium]